MDSIEINFAELIDSKPLKVNFGGQDLCLTKVGDEVFAISDTCSHAEASLSEGDIKDFKIECWLHGAEFDLRSGEALTPPAFEAIETFKVLRDGDTVTISRKK